MVLLNRKLTVELLYVLQYAVLKGESVAVCSQWISVVSSYMFNIV